MRSLTLSQVASILAIALVSTLVPACGSGGMSALRASARQSAAPSGPTVHEATDSSIIIIPGTTSTPRYNAAKVWTFTPGPGEVLNEIRLSGQALFVPGGGSSIQQSTVQVTCYAPSVAPGGATTSVAIGTSEALFLQKGDTVNWYNFYCGLRPVLNVRSGQTFAYPACPMTITLEVYNYPDWSGDLRDLKLQVYTVPFTTIANSPNIS